MGAESEEESNDGKAARAWEWLQTTLAGRQVPALVVVIGLGDGRLLTALDRWAPGRSVLALEPDAQSAAAFRAQDWAAWRRSGRLTYLSAPDYAGELDAWRAFPHDPDDHVLLVDPAVSGAATPEAIAALRIVKRLLHGARANAEARRRFAPRYLTNTLRNARSLLGGRDLAELRDKFRGVPAVVVAAGPSLDHAIPKLQALPGRGLLIAADTALRPLLAAGIHPHLVVGLDPGELNARHFKALPPTPDTWLIAEGALDPAAVARFPGRTLWFRVSDHEPWPWYRSLGTDVHQLDVWGSVLTAAFQVAVLAGCDPIVFVGADLSHAGPQPYCRGTTNEFDWARWTARGMALEDVWRIGHASATLDLVDVAGNRRSTTPALVAFRDWLAARSSTTGRRIVNASGAGLLLGPGIEQIALEEALAAHRTVPWVDAVLDGRGPGRDLEHWRRAFAGAADDLARDKESALRDRWEAFSGTGWDAAAVVDALRDGYARLGDTPRASLLAPPPPPHQVLTSLPELVGQWRTWLEGPVADGPPIPEKPNVDRDALLDLALAALAECLKHQPNPAGELANGAGTPVAAWVPATADLEAPDSLFWSVAAFEALLGAAAVPTAEPPSYFSDIVVPRESDPRLHPVGNPPEREHSALSLRLALEWLLCANGREGPPGAGLSAIPMTRALAASILAAETGSAEQVPTSLHLRAHRPLEHAKDLQFHTRLDPRLLARAWTGEVRRGHALQSDRALLHVRPRVFTDHGVARASIAYVTARGAVCVSPFSTTSFIVRDDGSTTEGHRWPWPILNEHPDEGDGLVAWSNGVEHWDNPGPAYVLWRGGEHGHVSRVDLPFRPGWGAWHGGRLYWTCVPSGLGSWAPDSDPLYEMPADSLIAVAADDDGLLLSPMDRDAGGVMMRRRLARGWRRRGGIMTDVPLGDLGPWTARVTSRDGWIATAYPEADLICLQSPDGHDLHMTCYYPFKLAWLGRSLLVSTVPRDLLLFEALHGQVAALR